MKQHLDKRGIPWYTEINTDDFFSTDFFHEVPKWEDDDQWAFHSNLGSLTVLDRLTGFGWRDTETGYRAPNGDFWLASGGFDVRESGAKTVQQAIDWVKSKANNCIPKTANATEVQS